ncbi:MAG: NTP transferase domain-containing protein [Hyphomicrobium sp.]
MVVVTGWDREGIAQALGDRDVHLAHNAGWEAGMGGSIAGGIAALDAAIVGAMIVPGDMPRLTARVVSSLIETFERTGRGPSSIRRRQRARSAIPCYGRGASLRPSRRCLRRRRQGAAVATISGGSGGCCDR